MQNVLVKSSRSSEQGTGSFYRPKICKQASPHVIRMVVKKCSNPNRVERMPEESVTSWTKRQLRLITAIREDENRRKYAGAFQLPFTPVILTSGGFPGTKCKEWLKRLRVHAHGKLASAFDLSVAIVRARAASLQ